MGNHLELGVPLAADSFQLVPREVLCEVYLRRLACVLHRTFLPHRTSLRAAAARPATSTRGLRQCQEMWRRRDARRNGRQLGDALIGHMDNKT